MEVSKYQLDLYRAEYDRIKKELPAVTKRKQDARAEGDLSENTEYDIAKAEHEQLVIRMNELENIINTATVINADTGTRIGLGSFVKVECLTLPDVPVLVLRVDVSGDPVSMPDNKVLGIKSALGKKVYNGVSGEYKIQTQKGELIYRVTKLNTEEAMQFYEENK